MFAQFRTFPFSTRQTAKLNVEIKEFGRVKEAEHSQDISV